MKVIKGNLESLFNLFVGFDGFLVRYGNYDLIFMIKNLKFLNFFKKDFLCLEFWFSYGLDFIEMRFIYNGFLIRYGNYEFVGRGDFLFMIKNFKKFIKF